MCVARGARRGTGGGGFTLRSKKTVRPSLSQKSSHEALVTYHAHPVAHLLQFQPL